MIEGLFRRCRILARRWSALSLLLLLTLGLTACGGADDGSEGAGVDGQARRAAALAPSSLVTGSEGESIFSESGKLVRTDESLVVQGNELFGDRVGLYQGSLEFVQSDVSLAGNSSLPVGVARRHTAPVNLLSVNKWGITAGHFGDWDLDIPHLHGVFAKSSGWTVGAVPIAQATERCSRFGEPSWVHADQTNYVVGAIGAIFSAREYWHGSFLYVPGSGSQEMLRRTNGPTPGDGAYPVTTKDRWLFKCLPTMRRGQGEGFIALSPEGTQYRFDWMVSRPYARLLKSTNSPELRGSGGKSDGGPTRGDADTAQSRMMGYFLDRNEVWIMPTEVIDRHGNKVTYTWSSTNPWQLLSIQDAPPTTHPRLITFSYLPNSYLVQKVTVGTREWNYSYRSTNGGMVLSSLQLPDQSRWTFNMDALTYGGALSVTGPSGCDGFDELDSTVFTGSMTHPSGAEGRFSVRPTAHGRSRVIMDCRQTEPGDPASAYAYYPTRMDRFSIVAKAIGGPGMPLDAAGQPATRWTYSYGPPNDSFAPCDNCSVTKTVTVTDPEGDRTRYTFGNEFRTTEGQLQVEEQIDHVTGAVVRRTDYTYKAPNTGPWPDPVGQSPQQRGNGELASRHAPVQRKVVSQDGATFTWSADAYEQFGKPVLVSRFSSLGYTRVEEYLKWQGPDGGARGYYDHLGKWVIGLTAIRRTQDGLEVERNEYDANNANRLRAWANGHLKQAYGYHPDGTLATRSDGAGKTTTFFNYKRGLAQGVTYADATGEVAEVDDYGQITSVTNAVSTTTSYTYDAMGRVEKISYPAGDPVAYHPTTISYEQRWVNDYGIGPGHWRQTVTTGAAVTERYFDAQWRRLLTRTWDADRQAGTRSVVVNRYDSDGRKIFESYPQRADAAALDDLPGTSSAYDALGRIKWQTSTGAGTTTTEYLPGFMRRTVPPRGYATTHEFQAFDTPSMDTITRVWAPEDVKVAIIRDIHGKAQSITRSKHDSTGASLTRSYVYDSFHRLCKTIEPETGASVQYYDEADNVLWRASGQTLPDLRTCDQGAVPAASKVNFTYDLRNRLEQTTYGDGSEGSLRSYTPDGLLAQASTTSSTWTYTYNKRRVLTQEKFWVQGLGPEAGWSFDWGRDAYANISSLSDPWGMLSYAPNALGQPTQVSGFASGVTFHPNGTTAGYTLANGITRSVSLNSRGLPDEWHDTGIMHDVYRYDGNGNVVAILDWQWGDGRSMGYDQLDRLTTANGSWGSAVYTYDRLENLLTSQVGARNLTHEIDPVTNRLLRMTGSLAVGIGYDVNGNVVQRGNQGYYFDIGNRLRTTLGRATYDYDAHGRRSRAAWVDGTTQMNAYAGTGSAGRLLFSRHSATGDTRFVYLGDKLIAEQNSLAGVNYVHTDALGSPVARSNAGGQIVTTAGQVPGRTRYEPYGATAAGVDPVGIGFTGHVNDRDTGLVYMQQRYYDPIAGRFLSVDPVTTDAKSGAHFGRYHYAENNPYKHVDPDGRVNVLFNIPYEAGSGSDGGLGIGDVIGGKAAPQIAAAIPFMLAKTGLGGAAALPRMQGMGSAQRAKTLSAGGFSLTKVSNSPGRNETWKNPDGSQVKVHSYGDQTKGQHKSGNNAHMHKQDANGNELSDRGKVSNDPNATHIGLPNPKDFAAVRGRNNGD